MKTNTSLNPEMLRAIAADNLAVLLASMQQEIFPSLVFERTVVTEYLRGIEDDLIDEIIVGQTDGEHGRDSGIKQRRKSMKEMGSKESLKKEGNNASFGEEIEEEIEEWLKYIWCQVAESVPAYWLSKLTLDSSDALCLFGELQVEEKKQQVENPRRAPQMQQDWVEQTQLNESRNTNFQKKPEESVKDTSNEAIDDAVRNVIILNEIALNEAVVDEIAQKEQNDAEENDVMNKEMNKEMSQRMNEDMDRATAKERLNRAEERVTQTDKCGVPMQSTACQWSQTENKKCIRSSGGPPGSQCKFRLRCQSKRIKNPFSQQYDQLTDQHLVQYLYTKTTRTNKTANSRRKPDAVHRNTSKQTQQIRKNTETAYSLIHPLEPYDSCELISINQSVQPQKRKNKENTVINRISQENRKIRLKQPQSILESRTFKLEQDVMLRVPFLRTLGVKFKRCE